VLRRASGIIALFGKTSKLNSIGIMQGRLSPDPDNKIQFFPKETWEEEFNLAAQCGFEEIELTMDLDGWQEHPVMTERGRDRLRSLAVSSGIKVSILCCDLFMKAPFFGTDRSKVDSHFKMLRQIISSCKDVGIELIEIPVIADARIKDEADSASLSKGLFECLDFADDHGVRLALETDLHPVPFRELLEGLNGRVGANYDTGNSVFFGYDPVEEIAELKDFIWNIHIKDCDRSDIYRNVPLGEGDADFATCFDLFSKAEYNGSFILQTARMNDDIAAASRFLTFTRQKLKDHFITPN
jgi:L-ribulose-5-phosphate 3-epimerase